MFPEKIEAREVTMNISPGSPIAVEINFDGKNVIKIPRLGELPVIRYEEGINSEPHLKQVGGLPVVEFNITSEIDETIALVWTSDRGEKDKWGGGGGEWIAIYKKGNHYSGPYALDELCSRKILEAYKVPEGKIPLGEVKKTDPKKLQQSVV